MHLIRPEFQTWITYAAELGFQEVLTPEDGFATELITSEKWQNANSCGIYSWITADKQVYVGQAVNVRNRLRQHWKNYRDIAYAVFQPVHNSEINQVETKLIGAMELKYPILNIKLAKSSAKIVPFDRIMSQQKIGSFLSGDSNITSNAWQNWPLLESKQRRRFERMKKIPDYLRCLSALKVIIEQCIPEPAMSEVNFWSVTNHFDAPHVFRVNVGQQEVFTLWRNGQNLLVRFLATEQFSDEAEGPMYSTQCYAHFVQIEAFAEWLNIEKILACRRLVVQLMRHTVPMNSGSHCPQLVRAAFDV